METLTFLMTSSFYPPHHLGGDATFVKYLAEELAKKGHEVHVLTCVDAYRLKNRKSPLTEIMSSNVAIHDLKSPYGVISPLTAYAFESSHFYSNSFSKIVKEINPDVVHHHNIALLGYDLFKSRGSYVSLHTTHDFWLVCPIYTLVNKGERCTSKHSFKNCFVCTICNKRIPQIWKYFQSFTKKLEYLDLIITPCDFFKQILEKATKIKVTHIPNFVSYPPKTVNKAQLNDYFLCAGRIEPSRGILTLLKVFSSQEIQSKLILVGTGGLSKYVSQYIKTNGLQNKIVYLGWVSNYALHQLYQSALATIEATNHPANFPLVALESLSHGTPVISSNMGGLPEIVEKIDKNLVYDTIPQLKQIIVDFDKSKYPLERVKAVFEKNYSPEAHLKRYLTEINSVSCVKS